MGVNRRIVVNQPQNNGRTITKSVGLNERFSQLGKGAANTKNKPSITNRLGPQNAGRAHVANIQSRLGKAKNAGIKKSGPARKMNSGPTKMDGIQNTGKLIARNQKGLANLRTNKNPGSASQKKLGRNNAKRPAANARGKPKASGKGKNQERAKPKPVSKDDLDKSLDEYMMKDPKTAQARLDDELNQYLADGDLVMDM